MILGQILQAGEGQNPARQAAMKAGCPKETTAWALNQLCGSGLRAVALGMQQIALGDARIIVAGGQESMSMAPHAAHLRGGQKMGDLKLVDTMLKDGLIDAFHGYHMGITAENVAKKYGVSREQHDALALALVIGGIAIAVGAMIDAAIVMIENAHKHLERARPDKPRVEILVEAAGPPGRLPTPTPNIPWTLSWLASLRVKKSGAIWPPREWHSKMVG